MRYEQKTFTLPASSNTSQMRWDMAFKSKQEFMDEYQITEREYDELAKE